MTILRGLMWLISLCPVSLFGYTPPLLSTEGDPDSFVQGCVQVLSGEYCEAMTDCLISGPDALILQRFYSRQDPILGREAGGWHILPQRFLVLGKTGETCVIEGACCVEALAFGGERSGGFLPYRGWREVGGHTKEPLKMDISRSIGMVNTYAQEIEGKTNHYNNRLHVKGGMCEMLLGDGSKRIYQRVEHPPTDVLGEEYFPLMASQLQAPEYFLLSQETLPSGNQIFFAYDGAGHLTRIEMCNKLGKVFSWLQFNYSLEQRAGQYYLRAHIQTSDARDIFYDFVHQGKYQLTQVSGSHCIPIAYTYQAGKLVKKVGPEGHFLEIVYVGDKVTALKRPQAQTGQGEVFQTFSYGKGYTDVWDARGVKTRYLYDERYQLTGIERYDASDLLYRKERKFWGKKAKTGWLLARTIEDGQGHIYAYRKLKYDGAGNVILESIYGNLTGKGPVTLRVSEEGKLRNKGEECHQKTFEYSKDGYNLLTKVGDCKGSTILYTYQADTNLLIQKFIYEKEKIKRRTFYSYNEDGVRIKTIEDDGSQEEENKIYGWGVTERHITEIQPKSTLPGVGLPEIIQEKAVDLSHRKEVLLKKKVCSYDAQSNLLACLTYAEDIPIGRESYSYNALGQRISQDKDGVIEHFSYDGVGNQITRFIVQANKTIQMTYDWQDHLIEVCEIQGDSIARTVHTYDSLGCKTSTTDPWGNTTHYHYDAFQRLTQVLYPEVLDENGQVIRPTFSYAYDIFNNVTQIIDPKGYVITKRYNLRGDPTRISYPDGSYELFKYDLEGSLHRSLTRDQIVTVYEYDYLGRPIYEESSTLQENGRLAFLKNKARRYNGFHCIFEREDDHAREYTLDLAGRIIKISEYPTGLDGYHPEARVTEITYDALDRIHCKKVWFESGTQDYALEYYAYDLLGNISEKRIEDAFGNILLQRYYSYNSQGLCTEEYSLEQGVKKTLVKTFYDPQGKPLSHHNGLDQVTTITMQHCLNDLGQNVVRQILTNPLGVETIFEFDALSRICAISKKDATGKLLAAQKHGYDALGNLCYEVHAQIVEGKSIGSQRVEWVYGPMGRLEIAIEAAGTPDARYTYYQYNTLGQRISKQVEGITLHYIYNAERRLYKIESQGKESLSHRYSYDRRGNIVAAHALHGRSIYRSYNVFNQVTKETIKDGEGTYELAYTYDRRGRLKEVTLPDSSKIRYTYDALFGRKVERLSAYGVVLYAHSYDSYDLQGNVLQETFLGDIGSQKYQYDVNGYKVATFHGLGIEAYERDALGRIVAVQGEVSKKYTYNDLSQLTSEESPFPRMHSYDSLDNRQAEQLIYNGLNQLIANSKAAFSYDRQGNLLRKVLDGEETHFTYNQLSQLTSLTQGQTAWTFAHDAYGRILVEKHLNIKNKYKKTLSTQRYFYIGYQEIGTLSAQGEIETLKIPGIEGSEISLQSIALELHGKTYVPLHDIAHNITHVLDSHNCQVVERYEYTAFGETAIFDAEEQYLHSSHINNPWRFAGKRQHASGLVNFGLRFYDPSLGRWITPDPAGFSDGFNLYSYLHNNPLNAFDRFGLATEVAYPNESYMYGEVETHCYCEKHRTCKRGGDIGKQVNGYPTISHCACFEKMYPDYERSRLVELRTEKGPLPENMGIGFINGVWNDRKGIEESLDYISKLTGGYNIHGVFNATHGKVIDFKECILGRLFIATDPVRQLHKMWNSFFEKSAADAKFLMICHSQGAIHTRNALLDYPLELGSRILVVAIAPGAYIYKETCAKIFHYRAPLERDFIPRLDFAGARREKDTIITLKSHSEAHFFDHEFMSPTYKERLEAHIQNYIKSGGTKFN